MRESNLGDNWQTVCWLGFEGEVDSVTAGSYCANLTNGQGCNHDQE